MTGLNHLGVVDIEKAVIHTEGVDGVVAKTGIDRSRMQAILGEAIARYRQGSAADSTGAANWMRQEDWYSRLSFNNVCSALHMDPESTRSRVLGATPQTELAAA